MPNNNETKKRISHKTNNSQSAGMTNGASNTPIVVPSVPQGMPQTSILPETENDNAGPTFKAVLGVSSGGQVIEPFQNHEEQKEDDLRSGYGLGLVDFGELGKLGSPYQASNIPSDQEA